MILPEGAVVVGCRRCEADIFQGSDGRWAVVGYPITDAYDCGGGAHAPAGSLFELGQFILPSTRATHFKIECDVLTETDWAALARLAVELLPPFGHVEGVPRGGFAFATALSQYIIQGLDRLLIADDVWVTGLSMGRQRAGRDAIGIVAFARNPVAPWVKALLQLSQAAEDATYQLNRPPNFVPS